MKLEIAAVKLGCKGSEERYPVGRNPFLQNQNRGLHASARRFNARSAVSGPPEKTFETVKIPPGEQQAAAHLRGSGFQARWRPSQISSRIAVPTSAN